MFRRNAKPRKGAATPPLSPEQLDAARRLYVYHSDDLGWVAQQLGVTLDSVRAACVACHWSDDRREASRQWAESRVETQARRIAVEREINDRHAATARAELDLRDGIIRIAHKALATMTPQEALRALRLVGSSKDLQFVERLARDLTTERISTETQDFYVDVVRAMLGGDSGSDGNPGDAAASGVGAAQDRRSGVLPQDGLASASRAGDNPSGPPPAPHR